MSYDTEHVMTTLLGSPFVPFASLNVGTFMSPLTGDQRVWSLSWLVFLQNPQPEPEPAVQRLGRGRNLRGQRQQQRNHHGGAVSQRCTTLVRASSPLGTWLCLSLCSTWNEACHALKNQVNRNFTCYRISAQEIVLLLVGTGLSWKSGKNPTRGEHNPKRLYNSMCLWEKQN